MKWLLRFLSMSFVSLAISACAVGPRLVDQQFTFDGRRDRWADKVDLLKYAYGDGYRMVKDDLENPRSIVYEVDKGLVPQTNINGPMPVGDFLYVKWRVQATGQIHEQHIDLRQRLPSDMKDHGLTFVIDGAQLYVYVITPKGKPYGAPPITKTWHSKSHYTYEIFPQHKTSRAAS